jgi:hypothetical protein
MTILYAVTNWIMSYSKNAVLSAPSGEAGLMTIRFTMRAIFQRKPPNLFHCLAGTRRSVYF